MGFIVAAIAAVVSAVAPIVAVIAPIVKFVVPIVAVVLAYKYQAFVSDLNSTGVGGDGSIGGGQLGGDPGSQAQGVLVTRAGSDVAIPVVYGYRKIGGVITFAETGSTNNQYLWVAYVLSEGPVEGLRELFIDDSQLPDTVISDLNLGKTVDVSTGKYKDRVTLQFSQGVYYDNPRNSSIGTWSIMKDAPSWRSSMTYNGLAVVFARYYWKDIVTQEDADANPFGGGIPDLQAGLLGRRVASIANAEVNDYAARTERYSINPVEHLCDYLSNPRYGKGLRRTDINWESWIKAANKCNQRVEYISGVFGPILTSNIVIDTSTTLFNNTKTMLATFRGYMPYSQGEYKLKIEDAGDEDDILSGVATIVNTFDDDNIVGTITYQTVEKANKYNSVKIGFADPDNKWSNAEIIYPETASERAVYIAEDNGRVNQKEVFFAGITNYAIAKDMAKLIFNKSRYQESCSLTVSSEGLELEVGDNIYIQSRMLNFSTIPWRIITISINNNMTVDIGCVRNPDFIYPHTRVGEEDIVLPPFIPRGATILYPAVQSTVSIGLVPPTNAYVSPTFDPPRIQNVTPNTFGSAGVNTVRVTGTGFKSGITALWRAADDATTYVGSVTRINDGELTVTTTAGMTAANQPYDLRVQNSSEYGSRSSTAQNILNVDGTQPPAVTDPANNPILVDAPVIPTPPQPDITLPPSDPPDTGESPNNPPDPAPEPVPLTDILEITNVTFTTQDNFVYATIVGKQPNNPMYLHTEFRYRRTGTNDEPQIFYALGRPGAGLSISTVVGPLLPNNTSYDIVGRVIYTTGEYSTKVNRNTFVTRASGSLDPVDIVEESSTAWPNYSGTFGIFRENVPVVSAQTVLVSGAPTNPRSLSITVRQDTNGFEPNFNIHGVKIFAKPIGQSWWYKVERGVGQGYVPGSPFTFTLGGTLDIFGAPLYPDIPTDAQQNWDFVFRFMYRDQDGLRQLRYMSVPVERSGSSYSFNPFAGRTPINELASAFSINFEPPTNPATAAEMTVNIAAITFTRERGTLEQIVWVEPPNATVLNSWAGMQFRIGYLDSTSTFDNFTRYTSKNRSIDPVTGYVKYYLPVQFNRQYEMVASPLLAPAVTTGVGDLGTNSYFGKGFISDRTTGSDIPTTTLGSSINWAGTFNFTRLDTEDALSASRSIARAPAIPRVQVREARFGSVFGTNLRQYDRYDYVFNGDHISNFTGVAVYRRQNLSTKDLTLYNLNYFGLGRWERIFIANDVDFDLNKFVRPAETVEHFNKNYRPGVDNVSLLTNASNSNVVAPGGEDDIIVVAVTTVGESTQGLLMPRARFSPAWSENFQENLLLGARPTVVNLSDYSIYPSQYNRNLSQARTAPASNSMLNFLKLPYNGDDYNGSNL